MIRRLTIEGISCNHCAGRVEKALKKLGGVDSVKVDLKNKTVTVELNKDIEVITLKEAVLDAGYEISKVE
ncbi:MAG: heavy metal-associated domain-containing protein [Firmicutes bacterium]|nr:heavy metal-associated domain-containing protein [Bacillota bacterium]MDD4263972.1 heavy metal-associated domain-containing protein [Bacillota bacterium]MDD4693034.1 heavy metal-associated domain-containing protein [Bacillota bacterium]